MWEWLCWGKEREKIEHHHHHHHHQEALLIIWDDDDGDDDPTATIASAAMVLTSCLRTLRIRYLLLALCCPLLLPFLCATFPILCAAKVCILLFRLLPRRRRSLLKSTTPAEYHGGSDGGEVRLLQRYLEDQLLLVIGSVYDCGDYGDDEDDCIGDLLENGVEFF